MACFATAIVEVGTLLALMGPRIAADDPFGSIEAQRWREAKIMSRCRNS